MKNETMAFPSEVIDDNAGIWDVKEGMDLRDYFASKAMLAEVLIDPEMENDYKIIARRSYEMADAMMEARK